MTTLDAFLNLLPNHIHMLSGQQKTPNFLNLSFSEEDFFELLEALPEEKTVFRFLEKTPKDRLLVHLAFLKEKITLLITIDVKNISENFGNRLCKYFPPAVIYISEINLSEQN